MVGRILTIGMLALWCGVASAQTWWKAEWRYRIPVTVDSGMQDRTDCLVRMPLDLRKAAKEGKLDGAITIESLRVVAVAADKGTSTEVPSVFTKAKSFKPGADERGMLIWQIKGEFPAMKERVFHVYLETSAKPAPAYDPIPGADEVVGVNLLPNGSFEQVDAEGAPAAWRRGGSGKCGGVADVTEAEAHTGKRSLHIASPKEEGLRPYFWLLEGKACPPVVVKPGRKYQASVWSKAVGTEEHAIQLHFSDAEWNALTDYAYTTHHTFGRGVKGWQRGQCTNEAPPGSRFAGIRLHGGSPGDLYYDDVELIMLPKVEPPKLKAGKLEKAD